MPDLLTRRNGTWHFVRRVPTALAHVDRRGVIRHSTRIRISDDRNGRRAAEVASRLNEQLELTWKSLLADSSGSEATAYDQARLRAKALGYEYLESTQLLRQPIEAWLDRLEALILHGVAGDRTARAALLGTEEQPPFLVAELFTSYEIAIADELIDLSPEQRRIWRNGRIRAVEQFVIRVGNKQVADLTQNDAIDYCDWWRTRALKGEITAKTANRDIGQLSRMLKVMSIRRRLNLPDIFNGLRLRGEKEKTRPPYENDFIQNRLLARGTLDGLNEEARHVVYVMADTGLRPSEIVNLTERSIRLDGPVPHVCVLPEGRRPKTEDSIREIPLVGAALFVMRQRPKGFPHYRDQSSKLSATINKFLEENGLRPTEDHTLYSLRHSFKDRLTAIEAPDSLIDYLMGHKYNKPKYGRGPSLELKLKYLQRIAFKAPT